MCAALTRAETVTPQAFLSKIAVQVGLAVGVHPGYRNMSGKPNPSGHAAGSARKIKNSKP
jgi:hypothetical protein